MNNQYFLALINKAVIFHVISNIYFNHTTNNNRIRDNQRPINRLNNYNRDVKAVVDISTVFTNCYKFIISFKRSTLF